MINEPSNIMKNPYLEPEKLFRSRYDTLYRKSEGVERFAFSVIPYSMLRSFAKLDPLHDFKWSPVRISPVGRLRRRKVLSALDQRSLDVKVRYTASTITPNCYGIVGYFCDYSEYTTTTQSKTAQLANNVPRSRCEDTTKRIRPIYSDYGEFENFEFAFHSGPRKFHRRVRSYSQSGGGPATGQNKSMYDIRTTRTLGPSGARLTLNTDTFGAGLITYLKNTLTEQGPGILTKTLPDRREWSAFRNIAELKDLPRSIASLRSGLRDLSAIERSFSSQERLALLKRSGEALKGIPSHYLSYWFGWNQMYRDARDLLNLPQKIAKRANWLLKQSGKEQTYRYKRDYVESLPYVDGTFSWSPNLPDTQNRQTANRREQKIFLRCVVNAKFDFPTLDTPTLNRQYMMDKIGLYPRIGDIYDLMPWSWLLDWFTGVGNYLELTEAINRDPSIFNYGFITAEVDGFLESINTYESVDTSYYTFTSPASSKTVTSTNKYRTTARLEYKARVRQDVADLSSATTTNDLDSLNPFQKSILGALITQKLL